MAGEWFLTAVGSPHWRPCFLPASGHGFSPVAWCSRGLDGAEAVGRSGVLGMAFEIGGGSPVLGP
jgi:hypothetical protein